MMNLNELVDDFMAESTVDYVGLWEIAQATREDLGADNSETVRHLTIEIVGRLLERGLCAGDYYLGSRFYYWPDQSPGAVLNRIDREWIEAGTDPNLAEPICYFTRPQN